MFRDDDCRRRMSTAYLDHRQDRLDLMRNQQRRTRSIYEGLLAGNESTARAAPGPLQASCDRGVAASRERGRESASAEIRRCRLAVLMRIESLIGFSEALRREWRSRFDAIDPWRLTADGSLERFTVRVTACSAILQDIAGQLAAGGDGLEAQCEAPRHADMRFGAGFAAIALRIRTLPFLAETTRQRWADEIERIDAAHPGPQTGFALRHEQADHAGLADAARRVLAEIDSTARCSTLSAALAQLRSACNRYRSERSVCGQSHCPCADADENPTADGECSGIPGTPPYSGLFQ
jgi:hypothetical protein